MTRLELAASTTPIKRVIKTFSLISSLKKEDAVDSVYSCLSSSEQNSSFCGGEVIISHNYLFVKDAVAVIPYDQITRFYLRDSKSNDGKIIAKRLYCDTVKKKRIKIFINIMKNNEYPKFLEKMKEKNPTLTLPL